MWWYSTRRAGCTWDSVTAMRTLPAALAATSLIAGYSVARITKKRPAGGAVLLAGGAGASYLWWRQAGAPRATVNTAIFMAAFVGSHPLAKKIGAWPSVLAVSGATALATYLIAAPTTEVAQSLEAPSAEAG